MQHHAPHPRAKFEGWYSKFDLQNSASSVTLVVCSVPGAPKRPHVVSFTYVRKSLFHNREPTFSSHNSVYQRELWVHDIQHVALSNEDYEGCDPDAFELRIPGFGSVRCISETETIYDIKHDDFRFHARSRTRMPWRRDRTNSTPEDWLVWLPLPLHWHVQSLASECSVEVDITPTCQYSNLSKYKEPFQMLEQDQKSEAIAHQEKNWATSFPKAHMWVQAKKRDEDGETILCCAGGNIIGMTAFLLGFRSKDLDLDFGPPLALNILGWGPFMRTTSDWSTRTFRLELSSLRWKVNIIAKAPEDTFFGLACPFPDGIRENYLGQSFLATVQLEICRRSWTGSWHSVKKEKFEGASLEFGGAFYPPAGSSNPFN